MKLWNIDSFIQIYTINNYSSHSLMKFLANWYPKSRIEIFNEDQSIPKKFFIKNDCEWICWTNYYYFCIDVFFFVWLKISIEWNDCNIYGLVQWRWVEKIITNISKPLEIEIVIADYLNFVLFPLII